MGLLSAVEQVECKTLLLPIAFHVPLLLNPQLSLWTQGSVKVTSMRETWSFLPELVLFLSPCCCAWVDERTMVAHRIHDDVIIQTEMLLLAFGVVMAPKFLGRFKGTEVDVLAVVETLMVRNHL
mgnify:CR=1 FL=1